ncbi:MAG: DUF2779 domain-containing protein [Bdellovibrionales bacterium]|nr:DUF2779 domain-containing protein [Bdellovibrionales bacterium]
MKNYRLSKSQYTKARRCLKALYLYHHEEKSADPRSDFTQNILDQGLSVGELATSLFPGGTLIDAKFNQLELALAQTKKALETQPAAIFEATFQHNDVLVRVDILKNNSDGTWDLIEVKSSTSINPKSHYDDIAIQKWVLENSGIKLNTVNVMLLNSEYVRHGELELDKLFKIIPLNDEIHSSSERIESFIPTIQTALNKDSAPVTKIGSKCKSPYPCEFKSNCWKDVSSDSIHFLGKMTDAEKLKLANLGVERITEIPDDYKMKTNHHVEVLAFKTMKPQISESAIKEYLGELKYPLYFLDYESVAYAVPKYDGSWPYRQLTTQYSLHILDRPGGELRHKEFIHDEPSDPSRAVAEQLLKDIGDDGGSIIVYHLGFERARTEELAKALPDLADRLRSLNTRMWDLESPFAKRWYWDHRFSGSSSIKSVLPILKPEFSYKDLAIQKGDQAQTMYSKMVSMIEYNTERLKIKSALLSYCERDSLAMYLILKELFELFSDNAQKAAV